LRPCSASAVASNSSCSIVTRFPAPHPTHPRNPLPYPGHLPHNSPPPQSHSPPDRGIFSYPLPPQSHSPPDRGHLLPRSHSTSSPSEERSSAAKPSTCCASRRSIPHSPPQRCHSLHSLASLAPSLSLLSLSLVFLLSLFFLTRASPTRACSLSLLSLSLVFLPATPKRCLRVCVHAFSVCTPARP